jgi:hypothetical protein
MGITSDVVFAIMPIFFLWQLHRPVMERVLVSILMALGMIAALAGVMKVYHINTWNPRQDTLRDWMPLFWWYRVEEIGLIAAACAPFLKPPIERMLGLFGVSKFQFVTIGLNSFRSGQGDTAMDSIKKGSTLQASGAQQSTRQNTSQASVTVALGSFDNSSDRVKHDGNQDCLEV